MKKVLEICCLISIIFIFLIFLLDISIEQADKVFLMKFIFVMLKIYFSISGFILVFKNLDIKTNNRANMMAVCYLLTSLIVVNNLIFYIIYGQASIDNPGYEKSSMLGELIEILFLFICVEYTDEYCLLKKWLAVMAGVFICAEIIIFTRLPGEWIIGKYIHSTMLAIGIGTIFAGLLIIAWLMIRRKIKQMPRLERRIFTAMYGDKMLISLVVISMGVKPLLVTRLLVNILQLAFYIIVFSYVNECSLSILWKKIDLDMVDKMEKVNRGEIQINILVAAAREIQRIIKEIDVQSKEIKVKMRSIRKVADTAYVGKIEKNCNRLLKLSGNILALNQFEKGDIAPQFKSVNLSELIGNIVESIAPYVEQKNIKLDYIHFNQEIVCDIDSDAIERIVLNLISNSVKYNKKNGSIKIFLSERKQEVYLSVQDTGIGMPEELLMKSFRRYERLDSRLSRQQEGSGLGLAIVKSLVDIHHGKIEIRSKENKGTLISIILPKKQIKVMDAEVSQQHQDLDKRIQVEFSDLGV